MSNQPAFDLVVVGSGGAALTAALTAADAGLRVVVLERTSRYGGTTATSSGIVWVPCNDSMADNGVADSVDDAVAYGEACGGDRTDHAGLRSFAEHAAPMATFLGSRGVEFSSTGIADNYQHFPGAKTRRSLMAASVDVNADAELERSVRLPPYDLGFSGMQQGRWAGGTALIVSLLRACAESGVQFHNDVRATSLVVDGDAVAGVRADRDGTPLEFRGSRGVVLACGGFERDPALMNQYHGARIEAAWSAPANGGDGLRMAEQVDAELANMDQVWWYALLRVTDDEAEGQPVFRDASPARNYPRSIVVDSTGRRFANEGQTYHDFGKAMNEWSGTPYWLIFDQRYVDAYGAKALGTTDPAGPHFRHAASIEDLAEAVDIEAPALAKTVERWNDDVAVGHDSEFDRGVAAIDQNWGDPDGDGAYKSIGPIDTAPYWATRIYVSTSGTNGGPRTDPEGRVIAHSGDPVAGLYAAGNTTASILGEANPAAGGTLGPMMTLAFRAGLAAARDV